MLATAQKKPPLNVPNPKERPQNQLASLLCLFSTSLSRPVIRRFLSERRISKKEIVCSAGGESGSYEVVREEATLAS